MRVLRFLPKADPDGDPIEWTQLEGTDVITSVWEAADSWCWSVQQGERLVDNGLAGSRNRARLDSRRYAAGVVAHVLDWGRFCQ